MSDVEAQISERVEAFVSELSDLVRQAALQAVSEALGGNGVSRRRPRRVVTARGAGRARPKGEKRDPAVLERTTAELLSAIKQGPGSGIEALGRSMSTPTRDLALPIKKLLAAKQIRKQGRKRATKYFATR